MIPKERIQSFRDRKLDDSEKIKNAPIEKVDAYLESVNFHPPVKLWEHQRRAVALGIRYKTYLFLLDMGMGKTLTTLCLFDYFKRSGAADRMLMVTPFSSVIDEWRSEMRHFPHLRFAGLDQTNTKNAKEWERYEDHDVLACTAAMLLTKLGVSKRSKADPEQEMERLVSAFDMLVFDESSHLRSHRSQIFNTLDTIADSIPYRYLLTGTPMDGDPMDLWAQYRIIDRGRAFGENVTLFRTSYFTQKMKRFGRGRVQMEYEFKQKYSEEIHRRTRHRAIRFEAREHAEMPEMIGGLGSEGPLLIKRAFMSDKIRTQYEAEMRKIKDSGSDDSIVEASYYRMRQICSGYISVTPDDPDESRFAVMMPQNPKLDLLKDVLNQLPEGTKVIVACWYKTSAEMVANTITEMGRKVARIDGGVDNETRKKSKEAFRQGDTNVLIGTKAIGYGGNYPEASHIIFFESPDSTIDREQFERRIVRGNSQHKTATCIDLVIADSVDEWILERLKTREKVTASVIRGLK